MTEVMLQATRIVGTVLYLLYCTLPTVLYCPFGAALQTVKTLYYLIHDTRHQLIPQPPHHLLSPLELRLCRYIKPSPVGHSLLQKLSLTLSIAVPFDSPSPASP